MLVVVLLPRWTLLNTVVDVSRRVSCRMLVFNVVLTCGVCLQVSQLSTSTDEPMCLVTALYALLTVQLGSRLDANSNPSALYLHLNSLTHCSCVTLYEGSLQKSVLCFT